MQVAWLKDLEGGAWLFQFSIGDARDAGLRRGAAVARLHFNSLLEMRSCKGNCVFGSVCRQLNFNSLLEMRGEVGHRQRQEGQEEEDFNSLLEMPPPHLRCRTA